MCAKIHTRSNPIVYLQVVQVWSGGGKLGHPPQVAHVDPSRVHGFFEGLAVGGDQGEVDALPHHLRDDQLREEEGGLMEESAVLLKDLLGGGRREKGVTELGGGRKGLRERGREGKKEGGLLQRGHVMETGVRWEEEGREAGGERGRKGGREGGEEGREGEGKRRERGRVISHIQVGQRAAVLGRGGPR